MKTVEVKVERRRFDAQVRRLLAAAARLRRVAAGVDRAGERAERAVRGRP